MDMEAIVPAPHWRCQANCACSAHHTPTMDVDRILYLDHVKADGCLLLFEEIVKMDLGGIVCKRKDSPYYADLRVAAGPTHAGFTAGVRWIEGNIRLSGAAEAEGSCCIVRLAFRIVRSGQQRIRRRQVTVGEHAKADRDSPEFLVLRRVNESRRGSACELGSAFQHIQGPRVSSVLPMYNFRPERGFWRSAAGVG